MDAVWCVTFGETEKNFTRKREAVAFLRRQSNDARIRPMVVKRAPGAYTFYGPGRDLFVLRANIDRLLFTRLRRRR